MLLKELCDYNASLLQLSGFRDYCPNGLQIEGRSEVKKIALAVTASELVLRRAIDWGADAVLVHHGFFWRNEEPSIVGIKKRRIALLLQNDVSLLAYHLPLDAHIELGNNAQLALRLGIVADEPVIGRFGEQGVAWLGCLSETLSLAVFQARVDAALLRSSLVLGELDRPVRRVAWCSGGAQNYFEQAIQRGVDVFLTGEVSEQQYHLAQESGVAFIAAGHHATERYGVQALGGHLAQHFGLECVFFDQDNPV